MSQQGISVPEGLDAETLRTVRALPFLIHFVRQRWQEEFVYTDQEAIERWLAGEFHQDVVDADAKAAARASAD